MAVCLSLSHTHIHTKKNIFFTVSLLYFSVSSGRRGGSRQGYEAISGEPWCQLGVLLPGRGELEREDKGKGVGTDTGGEKGREGKAEEAEGS